jgi:lipopolysaccharide/colanic/teichoic acid biosynthesis glycosyltransferase
VTPAGRLVKRLIDVSASAAGLVVLFPALVVIGAAVRVNLGAPVLFRQRRPGKNGELFDIVKFRTMRDSRDAGGALLPDEQRLTRFGAALRSYSIDELPELYNVLRGDMSLVGPRPLLVEYLPRYSPEQARRHDVKPGLTGWTQIHGRNALGWEEKFELDVWYVRHQSVWLDLKILGATVLTVLRREGIHAAGHATMPRFMGSAPPEAAPGAAAVS